MINFEKIYKKLKNIINWNNELFRGCIGTAFVFCVFLIIIGFLLHVPTVYSIGIILLFPLIFLLMVGIYQGIFKDKDEY